MRFQGNKYNKNGLLHSWVNRLVVCLFLSTSGCYIENPNVILISYPFF